MAKQLLYDVAARMKVLEGIRQLTRAVAVTLGPTGRNVLLQKTYGGPSVTKDGVTVAKEVELADPFENMGAKMAREVASKTSDVAGDGTTTATVLAEALYGEGLKVVMAGADPLAVRRGIEKAVEVVVEEIGKLARPVKSKDEVAQVAAISANNDRFIGGLVADAVERVGKDGVVTVEEGKTVETGLEFLEGLQFDRGYLSPYFVTNPEAMESVLEDCLVLLHEKKLSSLPDLMPLLEGVARVGKPLLVVAEEVEGEALAALVINRLRGALPCCAVKAPGFGNRRRALLEDMAILTGARLICEDLGVKLENVTVRDLGKAKKLTVTKDKTTIVGGAGATDEVKKRIAQIRFQIETTTSDYDREKLEERLAKLSGGVAIVKAGGATEAEVKEKKARIEDALHATRAAIEEGVVPGGGVALLRARPAVEKLKAKLRGDEKLGAGVVGQALEVPLRLIASNSGADGSVVAAELAEKGTNVGFDGNTREYVDMFDAGIIDPAKVARFAVQNAASVAAMMLGTETLVADFDEKKKDKAPVQGSVH
ncbi:MAG: chaperonin GroEL [Planctomycetes bacterium]|nr:chaperonin GroEL [Planctomycetota bacterium]